MLVLVLYLSTTTLFDVVLVNIDAEFGGVVVVCLFNVVVCVSVLCYHTLVLYPLLMVVGL